MKNVVVIAIGSRIMKDDGIGVWVAGAIQDRLGRENIDVVIAEADCEYGFEMALDHDHVIILDAMAGGCTPGQVTVLPLSGVTAQRRHLSRHDGSLIDDLAQDGTRSGSLIGIGVEEVAFGFGLGKTLQERFEAICDAVQTEVLKIVQSLADA